MEVKTKRNHSTSVMVRLGGDMLRRGKDENCISADDLTDAVVRGGEIVPKTFEQTHSAFTGRDFAQRRQLQRVIQSHLYCLYIEMFN